MEAKLVVKKVKVDDEAFREKCLYRLAREVDLSDEYEFRKRHYFVPVEGGRMRPHLNSEDEENIFGNY